jgi:hypothetical protein
MGRWCCSRSTAEFVDDSTSSVAAAPRRSSPMVPAGLSQSLGDTGATALEYCFKALGINQRIWNTGSINTQIFFLQKMKLWLCKSEKGPTRFSCAFLRCATVYHSVDQRFRILFLVLTVECKDYFSKSLFVLAKYFLIA